MTFVANFNKYTSAFSKPLPVLSFRKIESEQEAAEAAAYGAKLFIIGGQLVWYATLFFLAPVSPCSFGECLKQKNLNVWHIYFLSVVVYNLVHYSCWGISPGFLEINSAQEKVDHQGIELRWCSECQLYQPLRSKHCDKCGRCVLKYDHHCFWIGACVGQENHREFWFVLLSSSVYLVWSSCIACQCISVRLWESLGWNVWHNALPLGFCILGFVMSVFVVVLLVFHSFLAATAQTTWEINSRKKITYFRHCRVGAPFSRGVARNIWSFFLKKDPKIWTLSSCSSPL